MAGTIAKFVATSHSASEREINQLSYDMMMRVQHHVPQSSQSSTQGLWFFWQE